MSKPLSALLANVWLVKTTIPDGGAMAFAMTATTTKVATGTAEIAAWDLLKTTIGVLFVLAWILMTLILEVDLEDVDLLNGKVMDTAMTTTTILDAIMMEVNS